MFRITELRLRSAPETVSLSDGGPLAGCIHATRAFHASSQVRLIIVCQFEAISNSPLLVTVPVALLRDRVPRGHTLVTTTSSRCTCRTSAVLVASSSSGCGLLLEHLSVLIGGQGGDCAATLAAGSSCERGAARRLAEFFLDQRCRKDMSNLR